MITLRGVSNKHCLLTPLVLFYFRQLGLQHSDRETQSTQISDILRVGWDLSRHSYVIICCPGECH